MKGFYKILGTFWKIEFLKNSTGADLTKIVKILYYLKLYLESIFWQNHLFQAHYKKVFSTILNWLFSG